MDQRMSYRRQRTGLPGRAHRYAPRTEREPTVAPREQVADILAVEPDAQVLIHLDPIESGGKGSPQMNAK